MPNWVSNTVSIVGSKEDLEAIKSQLNQPITIPKYKNYVEPDGEQVIENPLISFRNIIPVEKSPDYNNQGWYEDHIRTWGVKWDVFNFDDGSGSSSLDDEFFIGEQYSIAYRFETAWSPVEMVVQELSRQYPRTAIEYWYEEEQGWGGLNIYYGGSLLEERKWDIATSHADYLDHNRDQQCPCEDGWGFRFDDCPTEESND